MALSLPALSLRALSLLALPLMALSLLLPIGCGGDDKRPADPHVILISVDTLRSDHVGLYGYQRDTTPHIDRFFASGTVFENASSSAPCTVPSVRQLLSGGFDVQPGRKQIAEVLRDRGYATAAIVSQHMFFDETERDYSRGFSHFDLQGPGETDAHGFTTRTADQVSDKALAWLALQDDGTPIFLWLHYFDPHDPYEPPSEFRHFDAGNSSARSGDRRADLQRERLDAQEPWVKAGYVFDEQDVAHLVNLYDGEIAFSDAQIGRVLDELGGRGWVEDSIVVFTSDHGEWLGENGWWDHCLSVREQEVRVPLAIRVRGGELAGQRRVPTPASTLDIVPTVLGLLGTAADPATRHGVDLRRASRDRVVLSMWDQTVTARNLHWKLFEERQHSIGLFRIDEDPYEERNVLHARADIVKELEAAVQAARPLLDEVSAEWEETTERLRSIGYIQ